MLTLFSTALKGGSYVTENCSRSRRIGRVGLFDASIWREFRQYVLLRGTANHVIEVDNGYKSGNFDVTGIRMGPEGDPFRAMAEHCVGSFTIMGGHQVDTTRCVAENAAGDKVFGVAIREFDPNNPGDRVGSFRILHGTGKFAGITGEGKHQMTDVISHTPTQISGCARSWGTYTIKK
jgi:hypothetical protein